MKKIKALQNIEHNGSYMAGTVFELPEDTAMALVQAGLAAWAEPPQSPQSEAEAKPRKRSNKGQHHEL
ncbi:hypothetical protein QG083_05030 [Kingella kingae]|uniref:hypothetical protein n=1 Tax=Kingella kingae TaxID=504 RepID=UPI00254C6037|nr:hypothetical protein [Kingella kingae]MDK4545147.1 hypothetical protein [Kingella kingae]MDK4612547.1 hypothetical protein [Kingella kingae]MDK4614677.1 hypothetical protein [Kingella kingae]MDK4617010.1 hypothetical protein [Kingella kingae]MDK4620930.1 hypothetical protein [Kingella kingae]